MEKGGHIQVFEHQYLRVGEEVQGVRFTPAHFEALARHADIGEGKYFTVLHQGIRFSSYVGVLQAGTLTIEILPKASRPGQQYYGIWQQALLEMLKDCRLL